MATTAILNSQSEITHEVARARAHYVANNPKSEALYHAAKDVMPGSNTRTVLHYDPFPVTVARAEGAQIEDVDGHGYNDFLGEYTAGLYGHSHPKIVAAIKKALDQGLTLGGPNLVEAKLARLMCERFPAVERVRFCNSGTESNILALSAARAFTRRDQIIVVDRSYHGSVLTFVTPSPLNLPFPLHFITYNDTQAATELIHKLGDRLAAVLVEPMIGAGGGIPATSEFLQGLRSATEQSGALLIFDEVMTSRLTAHGLHGYHAIQPDLITFGKYLGGGLTFGAFGGRADILDRFDPSHPDAWQHAGTFNNNILTMSAGYAGLSEVFYERVADEFFDRGNRFRDHLTEAVDTLGLPVQITGMGSMMVFHITDTHPTAPLDPKLFPKDLFELIHLEMMDRGQFFARRGMINLSLPMQDAQLEALCESFIDVLRQHAVLISDVL